MTQEDPNQYAALKVWHMLCKDISVDTNVYSIYETMLEQEKKSMPTRTPAQNVAYALHQARSAFPYRANTLYSYEHVLNREQYEKLQPYEEALFAEKGLRGEVFRQKEEVDLLKDMPALMGLAIALGRYEANQKLLKDPNNIRMADEVYAEVLKALEEGRLETIDAASLARDSPCAKYWSAREAGVLQDLLPFLDGKGPAPVFTEPKLPALVRMNAIIDSTNPNYAVFIAVDDKARADLSSVINDYNAAHPAAEVVIMPDDNNPSRYTLHTADASSAELRKFIAPDAHPISTEGAMSIPEKKRQPGSQNQAKTR